MITENKFYMYTYNRKNNRVDKRIVYGLLKASEVLKYNKFKLYDVNGFSMNKYIYCSIVNNPDNTLTKSIYFTVEDDEKALSHFKSILERKVAENKIKLQDSISEYESFNNAINNVDVQI